MLGFSIQFLPGMGVDGLGISVIWLFSFLLYMAGAYVVLKSRININTSSSWFLHVSGLLPDPFTTLVVNALAIVLSMKVQKLGCMHASQPEGSSCRPEESDIFEAYLSDSPLEPENRIRLD